MSVEAIQAQIDAIYQQTAKLDAQLWAICSRYEAYTADQLQAVGDRLIADAADARLLQDAQKQLYGQLDSLYAELDLARHAAYLAEHGAALPVDDVYEMPA